MNELAVAADEDDVASGHLVLDEGFLHGREAFGQLRIERLAGRLGRDGRGQGEGAGDSDENTG